MSHKKRGMNFDGIIVDAAVFLSIGFLFYH